MMMMMMMRYMILEFSLQYRSNDADTDIDTEIPDRTIQWSATYKTENSIVSDSWFKMFFSESLFMCFIIKTTVLSKL